MSNTCEVCGKVITGMNASRRKACAGACSVERTRRYWHAKNAERWKDPAYRARSLARNNYHFHNTPKYRDRHRAYTRDYIRERYANDPEYRERRNRQKGEYMRRRYAKDPEFRRKCIEKSVRLKAKKRAERRAELAAPNNPT